MLGLDPADPFYRPFWRRAAIAGICVAWAGIEALYLRDSFWFAIAFALAAFVSARLIFFYKEPSE